MLEFKPMDASAPQFIGRFVGGNLFLCNAVAEIATWAKSSLTRTPQLPSPSLWITKSHPSFRAFEQVAFLRLSLEVRIHRIAICHSIWVAGRREIPISSQLEFKKEKSLRHLSLYICYYINLTQNIEFPLPIKAITFVVHVETLFPEFSFKRSCSKIK